MVMAGAESVSGSTTDESLSSRLQWLRQRREALQEKLTLKNNELKNLCIEEAELTGVLPPEIPLEPGESPPNFRKRSGSNYNCPEDFINKLKTNGMEESALELERQVQMKISEAALEKLKDPNENKAVRRKHRSIFQQSQRRLQELNAQLNFIRQSHGSGLRQFGHIFLHRSQPHLQTTTRHKTKKPRPPLDISGKDLSPKVESRSFLQEGGISLSPLGPEHNYNSYPAYDFQDISNHYPPSGSTNQNRSTYHAPSPVEHRRSATKFDELNNVNNNVYIPVEHFRNRTYSQGGNSTGSSVSPLHFPPERPHRPVPNTYSEEERQMHYRQLKLKRQESEEMARSPQYQDPPKYVDNEHRRSAQIAYYDQPEYNASRYSDSQMHEVPKNYHHGKPQQQPPVLRPRENLENKSPVDAYIPPGYWMRLDDEIVWCTDDKMASDRFGSLDRRKQHIVHSPTNAETQSRYHTVAVSGKNATVPHSRPYPMPLPMNSPDAPNPPTNQRILLRTQSLGSVETWPQQPRSPSQDNSSIDGGGRESADSGSISRNSNLQLKPKEKEWYETSLDTGNTAPAQRLAMRHASQHNPLPIGPPVLRERTMPVRSNSIPSNRRIQESQQNEDNKQQVPQRPPPIPQSRFQESRVLEIPAESKPLPGSQENGNETMIPMNSPTNHTVVQPGMYQPYREVTKPFEMSDFYKYSTKFRKRTEVHTTDQPQQQQQQIPANLNTQNDQNSNNQTQRIHQPVQRNNCPPYNLR